LLVIVLGAGGLARDIPKVVLAGILIKVGTDIVDWDYLKRIRQAPKAGVVIMFTVFVITVAIDLLLAVGVGMVMASFLFMHRMTQMQIAGIETVSGSGQSHFLSDEEAAILDSAERKIMLFHLTGPMSFSSAKAMVRRHASATAGYQIMLLDLSDVPSIDFTTARALEDILIDTKNAGRRIFLVGCRQQVCDMLRKLKITGHFKPGKMYEKRLDALLHARRLLKEIQQPGSR
jgi:SulP family sulfate permease